MSAPARALDVVADVVARRRHDPKIVSVMTVPAPNGHMHCAVFDDDGNGRTTRAADGHFHDVAGLEVLGAKGHTHGLSARRCAHSHEAIP